MKSFATPKDVLKYLDEYKECVLCNNFYVVSRKKNNDCLIALGLTKDQRKEIILQLSVIDYIKGPEADFDKAGSIWIFGKVIGGYEVYIKLKLIESENQKIAKCLSFHIADYPMTYPFK